MCVFQLSEPKIAKKISLCEKTGFGANFGPVAYSSWSKRLAANLLLGYISTVETVHKWKSLNC